MARFFTFRMKYYTALSLAFVLAVAYYGYFKQPLIDYRPYPIGTRLVSAATVDDGNDEEDFIFIYRKDGVEQEFTIDEVPDEEDGWEYVTRYHARRPHGKVIMQYGNQPSGIAIHDEDGNDVTLDVLADSRRTVLLLFPDLAHVGVVHSFALNELTDAALVADADVVGLTPATPAQVEHWKDVSMASYPIYYMDDSELKMVARGNPAVVYLEDGTIKWKRTLSSLDDVEQPVELSEMGNDLNGDDIMTNLWLAYLAAMLALVLINRSHVLIKRLFFRKKTQPTTN